VKEEATAISEAYVPEPYVDSRGGRSNQVGFANNGGEFGTVRPESREEERRERKGIDSPQALPDPKKRGKILGFHCFMFMLVCLNRGHMIFFNFRKKKLL
jgi:hypothetical protein